MSQWRGFGPSASSQYKNKRFTNTHSIEDWLKWIACGQPRFVDEIDLSEQTLAADFLIFGLRKNEGIDLAECRARYPNVSLSDLNELWGELRNEGYLIQDEDRVKLTIEGRLIADQVGVSILECMEPTGTILSHFPLIVMPLTQSMSGKEQSTLGHSNGQRF